MFTSSPAQPKDYILKDVNNSLRSSPQFTPDALPRVTQSNVGKFCFPIQYADDEVPEKRPPVKLEPVIKEKMTNYARASWVVEPGKDDFFIHDVYRKYSVSENSSNFDPRYKHKEKVFNRSYKYELDCTEAVRLEKLRQKCQREHEAFEGAFDKLVHKQREKEKPKIKVAPCKAEAPFWWQGEGKKTDSVVAEPICEEENIEKPINADKTCTGRWIEEPNLTGFVKDDPCRRRYEINLVGQPFRTEACNWYYKNYPSPDIVYLPKRFA